MKAEKDPLFCYSLRVQKREFLIAVTDTGFIWWDDYQDRRRKRNPKERYLEIQALLGSRKAGKRLSGEIDEFTVSFELSPEMFRRFKRAARLFKSNKWTIEHESELDEHLIPLFWSEVNPYINEPLKP